MATLKQGKKILTIFEDAPSEKIQALIESGYLADLRDGDISRLNRNVFRQWLGLDPIGVETRNAFLRLISGEESIVIDPTDATDGREILAEADGLFVYFDPDFRNWRADEPGQPTGETVVDVYEMKKHATFQQMFGSLGADPRQPETVRRLCLTQPQIKGFVRKHRLWLREDGYGTFFLFESYGRFFVAYVDVHSDGGIRVRVYRFEDSRVWRADFRHRLVVPRLVA